MKRIMTFSFILLFAYFTITPINAAQNDIIGKQAPSFTLLDLNGKKVSLSDYKDKVVILDFWATWCPPCIKEIPHFIELYNEYKNQGLVIVGISVDQKGVGIVKSFNRKYKINYPILMADNQVSRNYGNITGIPTTFVIDQAGKIRRMYVGYRDKAVFEEDIKQFLPVAIPGQKSSGVENHEIEITPNKYITELNTIGMAGRSEINNAAPYYQKAIELYVNEPDELNGKTRSLPDELSAQEQALLSKWVQDNSSALNQLQLGSNKPYCWFTKNGPTLDVNPYLQELVELAFVLQARTFLQPENTNINSIIADLLTLFKFGIHISSGPNLSEEKMVGFALKGLSLKAVFYILDQELLNSASMKSLEDRLKQLATNQNEAFDIRGDKINMQEKVETTYTNLKGYLKSTLEYCDMVAARTPWKLKNDKAILSANTNPWIENIAPAIARSVEIEYRSRTEVQALITTLAILRYNNENNRYPASLSELKSAGYLNELPKDPFSDKSLVYRKTEEGFILYSLGGDFDDDGGQQSKWGLEEENGDQVFWPIQNTP
ncbi:MAG: TlpA disulfide reductase family protein [Sedimentisphaerales bacterium]|nr:TlpA disulfide reductase family protein [Sedimentisphaerales bacterium]